MSVVVVSNRVARPKENEAVDGGLAAALLPAVRNSGAIWVGSSGKLLDPAQKEPFAEVQALGSGALATVDFPSSHYKRYYEGFANSVLWPALHSRPDLIRSDGEDYLSYREVNSFVAKALLRFAKPDGMFWVHDYHFLPLGQDLRRRGIDRPIGFFLHTPFPARSDLIAMPHHRELIRSMLAYDLIGFQTDADLTNFKDYLEREFATSVLGGTVLSAERRTKLASFPIGIDAGAFARQATKAAARPDIARLRASLQGAKLAIGVDRVDYSKGLLNRLRSFDRLFRSHPELKRQLSFLQVAVPSRGQIDSYKRLQSDLTSLVGEINGRHGEVDWTPVRYLNRGFPQTTLAGYYRAAQVGVVTPLRDGMNLVAKEYVAAQNPLDPGVLVLSEFAGAAKQLQAALIVNPHDLDGVARAVARAAAMPLEERVERWTSMMDVLERSSLGDWFSNFVDALADRAVPARRAGWVDPRQAGFGPRRELSAARSH